MIGSESLLKSRCILFLDEIKKQGLLRKAAAGFYPTLDQCVQLDQEIKKTDSFLEAFKNLGFGKLDLTTNEYLGLRYDWQFLNKLKKEISQVAIGSGGSRYLGGEHPVFQELEWSISKWQGCESTLLFPTGYAANQSVVKALHSLNSKIYCDRLNHASTMEVMKRGSKLAPNTKLVKHGEIPSDFEPVSSYYTEGLFSMDGNLFDIDTWERKINSFKNTPLLILDEAHSVGCYGENGQGLVLGERYLHALSIKTFGKALGSSGACVCGPSWFIDYLRQHAKSQIYSTAMSPMVAKSVLVGIQYVSELADRRNQLHRISALIRSRLKGLGFEVLGSDISPIVPILMKNQADAISLIQFLSSYNIEAKVIRYPTVKKGLERIRLSLHALLTQKDIAQILDLFSNWIKRKANG